MSERILVPEILDRLDPADPEARRSRRDLRALDVVMGNSRWIVRSLAGFSLRHIVELGAGEGWLVRRLTKESVARHVSGIDLLPRPPDLPAGIGWLQGDLAEVLPTIDADAVVASLVLHHFSDERLRSWGECIRRSRVVVVSEPWRDRFPLHCSYLAWPFVGRVTRHDMPVSIRAGFRKGELPGLMGLDGRWKVHETCRWRGAVRLLAWRN
ncbi:MAG: class I SAM-dependent methyltransferase [Terrimicrobiaceae bacterium]|nr:class I SAM-dependent methyltransferase [Terrimicrobiaceae bacterium]